MLVIECQVHLMPGRADIMDTIKVAVANVLDDWEEIEKYLNELDCKHGGKWEMSLDYKWFLGEIKLERLLLSNGLISQSCL